MSTVKPYKADQFKKTIKRNIKSKLRQLGWTPAKFAAEVGVTPSMVSRWLGGEAAPGIVALARICNALNEPPEYFFGNLRSNG